VDGEGEIPQLLSETFRAEWARLVAAVMRLVGDLRTAEDVVQDVLLTALDRWPLAGVPDKPAAWLMTACRNRAFNVLRDAGRARDRTAAIAPLVSAHDDELEPPPAIGDDRLRLVFICCHPVLPVDAQVALTLRMLGGLSTVEIARAWHVPTATMAQRIVRAKRVLTEQRVPFEEPAADELADRLPAVLDVVYLIFNEGYLPSAGDQLTKVPLAAEAHRLARLLTDLLPGQPEVWALRALIAFGRSRDDARTDQHGNLIILEYQDRSRWNQSLIDEGVSALATAEASTSQPVTSLAVQARIAACHATAVNFAATDWNTIVGCYDQLLARNPNPVVALNRTVAVAMAHGPRRALALVDTLIVQPALTRSHRVWAVRADLHRRLGNHARAAADYERALALVDNDVERRYLTDMRDKSRTQAGQDN